MRTILFVTFLLAAPIASWPTATQSQQACQFVLGFKTLRDTVGPEKVGTCLEDEHLCLSIRNGVWLILGAAGQAA